MLPPNDVPDEQLLAPADPDEADFEPSAFEAPVGTAPAARRTARRAIAAIGLLVVLVLAGAIVGAVVSPSAHGTEVRYVVPDGTAAGLKAGTATSPLPATIQLRTVDTLVIVNEDDAPFTFGAFVVRVGETYSHRFTRRGTYGEVCSLHPAGSVTIVVT